MLLRVRRHAVGVDGFEQRARFRVQREDEGRAPADDEGAVAGSCSGTPPRAARRSRGGASPPRSASANSEPSTPGNTVAGREAEPPPAEAEAGPPNPNPPPRAASSSSSSSAASGNAGAARSACARTSGPPDEKVHSVSPVRRSSACTVPSSSETSRGSLSRTTPPGGSRPARRPPRALPPRGRRRLGARRRPRRTRARPEARQSATSAHAARPPRPPTRPSMAAERPTERPSKSPSSARAAPERRPRGMRQVAGRHDETTKPRAARRRSLPNDDREGASVSQAQDGGRFSRSLPNAKWVVWDLASAAGGESAICVAVGFVRWTRSTVCDSRRARTSARHAPPACRLLIGSRDITRCIFTRWRVVRVRDESRSRRGSADHRAPDAHARHTLHQQQWPLPLPPLPSSPPASRSPGTSRARVSRDGFRRAMLSAARSDDDWPIGLSRARSLARLATPRVGSSATLTSNPPRRVPHDPQEVLREVPDQGPRRRPRPRRGTSAPVATGTFENRSAREQPSRPVFRTRARSANPTPAPARTANAPRPRRPTHSRAPAPSSAPFAAHRSPPRAPASPSRAQGEAAPEKKAEKPAEPKPEPSPPSGAKVRRDPDPPPPRYRPEPAARAARAARPGGAEGTRGADRSKRRGSDGDRPPPGKMDDCERRNRTPIRSDPPPASLRPPTRESLSLLPPPPARPGHTHRALDRVLDRASANRSLTFVGPLRARVFSVVVL